MKVKGNIGTCGVCMGMVCTGNKEIHGCNVVRHCDVGMKRHEMAVLNA